MDAAGKDGKDGKVAQQEAKEDKGTGDTSLDCPVCLTALDDDIRRPRILPCGHSVCTLCINELQEQGHVICPECRGNHAVPEGGQFPVSYTLEAVIRRLRNAEAAAAGSPSSCVRKEQGAARAADQKGAAAFSKRMHSLLQEQKAEVEDAISACQEAQLQLDQYQATLTDWGEQQQHLQNRLQAIIDQSKSATKLVRKERSRVAAKKEEINKSEVQLHAALETLRTVTPEQEAGTAVSEVIRCTSRAEQVVEECQESFPDVNTGSTVRKVREVASAAVEAAQAVKMGPESHSTVTTEELGIQSDQDSTIMGKLWAIVPPSLKDLRSLSQSLRSMLEAGRIFAVHQVEGQCQHARISLEAGQLYLYRLKKNLPPPGAKVLQMSQVVPRSPPCMVFLDLSWPGCAPRRVQVNLSRDTPRGRQFAWLCTGQQGPSYAGTKLLKVVNKGQPGEWVGGGDYERNEGDGNAVLLPGLGEGQYWQSGKAGGVFGLVWTDKTKGECGQFGITTLDKPEGSTVNEVFGEVVDGLNVVAEASKHADIKKVIVEDCGVVL